jgi:hypothetical protein
VELKTHYFCIGLEFFASARNKDAAKLVREPATAMQRIFDISQIVTLLRQMCRPDLVENGVMPLVGDLGPSRWSRETATV